MADRGKLPPNIPKRGLSLDEAAEYVGLTAPTFTKAVEAGVFPPMLPLDGAKVSIKRNVWDRKALDAALDGMSGLNHSLRQDPADQLRAAIDGRKAKVRHQAKKQAA